jgi:hypothetical protein
MDHTLPGMVLCRGYSGAWRGVSGRDIMIEKYTLIKSCTYAEERVWNGVNLSCIMEIP